MSRSVRAAFLIASVFGAFSSPAPGQETPAQGREQQIETIQKQIEALTKQLQELKTAETKPAPAAGTLTLDPKWIETLKWRSIGPAAMGGRIVALAVYEADPSTYWVATASGGLLKTTNNGITFEHQFDREATVSIGDVAVAPTDPNIVWVGTGENNARNSVSYGDGVYKSTDGGKTWKNMGLPKSYQVGRIAIHPKDPNVVYVGVLGRLWGPNEDRGVYKTIDGGQNWEKVLYIDDKTGVTDLVMHPTEPDTLIAATYERRRNEFDQGDPDVKFGPGSGLHKTTDGGKTWKKLTQGLPTVKLGRVGLDASRKTPGTFFAIIESEEIGKGPKKADGKKPAYLGIQGEDAPDGAKLAVVTPDSPGAKAGLEPGDLVLSIDDKETKGYSALIENLRDRFAGDKAKIKLKRGEETKEIEVTFGERPAGRGGVDPDRPFAGQLGGQRENVQDQQGPEGFQTGGVYRSADGGETWTRINSLNPRPFYFSQVRVDPSDDNYLYVLGIALYRSNDGGKTFKPDGGRNVHADQHDLWIDPRDGRHMILGCDGGFYATYDRMQNWDHLNHLALGQFYHVAIDTRRRYNAYGGLQDNGTWGGPTALRTSTGPVNEDWMNIGGGDGFQCQVDPTDPNLIYYTSQYGALQRIHLATGERSGIRPVAEKGLRYRFNWNTPFILSKHNPRIYYAAGNHVFRSLDRGNDLRSISPEITRTPQGTATALAESPRNPNLLYVGTDDGKLWVTRDGGAKWDDVTAKLGLPGPRGISTIEASRFEEGRCFVAVDGHRNDDDKPYLFVSDDYGQTWTSITANLPIGSTRCLREDLKNPDLLYCGTEFAIWCSIDRGKSWSKINSNLPTVAIHEIAIHPTAGEIVAATHGRSLWVLDVSPLQQVSKQVVEAKAHLFRPVTAVRWKRDPSRGGTNRRFAGENPPNGAQIYFALGAEADKASLRIVDAEGKTVRDLTAPRTPGLHRVTWDLTRAPESRPTSGDRPAEGNAPPASLGENPLATAATALVGRRVPGRPVTPGTYGIVLKVGDKEYTQSIRVDADPAIPVSDILVEEEEAADEAEFDEEAYEREIDADEAEGDRID